MGGITEILVYGILWGFGGYLNFNSSIEIMSSMYDHDDKCFHEGGNSLDEDDLSIDISHEEQKEEEAMPSKAEDEDKKHAHKHEHEHEHVHKACDTHEHEPNFQNFKLSTCARIQMYFLSTFGCVDICFKKKGSENIKALINKITDGKMHLDKDFNIKGIVNQIKINKGKTKKVMTSSIQKNLLSQFKGKLR